MNKTAMINSIMPIILDKNFTRQEKFNVIDELLQQYANEVSRERTFEFLRRFFGIDSDCKEVNAAYDKYFKQEQP